MTKFREIVCTEFRTSSVTNIDESTKTIKNLRVLNSVSRNNRVYTERAIASAAKVFEGKRAYINHEDINRDPREYIGVWKNLRVEGNGVNGDLHIVNETYWPLLSGAAKNDPGAFGFSINAEGLFCKETRSVLDISAGHSIDLVAHTGTTNGLFESFEEKDETMDWSKVTLSDLLTNCKPIVESYTTTAVNTATTAINAKLTEATTKIAELEKKLALTEVDKEITKLSGEHKVSITANLRAMLLGCDADTRKNVIKELAEKYNGPTSNIPAGSGGGNNTVTDAQLSEAFSKTA